MLTEMQNEYSSIEKFFLDAGCGAHLPGILFALGGFKSIGLEIDRLRCALAADILRQVLTNDPDLALALFNKDIKDPGNWSRVSVFFFWDKVRVILFSPQCINEFCFN